MVLIYSSFVTPGCTYLHVLYIHTYTRELECTNATELGTPLNTVQAAAGSLYVIAQRTAARARCQIASAVHVHMRADCLRRADRRAMELPCSILFLLLGSVLHCLHVQGQIAPECSYIRGKLSRPMRVCSKPLPEVQHQAGMVARISLTIL